MSEKQGGISNECELRNIWNISVENILTGTIETIPRKTSVALTAKGPLSVRTVGVNMTWI